MTRIFDTRAALARILAGQDVAPPISKISKISTGAHFEGQCPPAPDAKLIAFYLRAAEAAGEALAAGYGDGEHDQAERAALAAHYAAEPLEACP